MKASRIPVLIFLIFTATFAVAASGIPQVQHVIVVIQENRTPDNLFNQDTTLSNNGAHVQPSYLGVNNQAPPCNGSGGIPLSGIGLYTCWDIGHAHADWTNMWDNGNMDGACQIHAAPKYCNLQNPPCVANKTCPYTYVQNSPWSNHWGSGTGVLDNYFTLANQYGFANFMFQTNQGPSF